MATAQIEALGISPDMKGIDLPLLVQEATWKEVLIELVHRNKFDPWNVDIGEIVDKYIETVKALRVMDLRMPANIILASAVLLRLKSEMLSVAEPEPEQIAGVPYERPDVEVDALSLRPRPQVKRRIALVELIQALEEAMVIKERRESAFMSSHVTLNMPESSRDIGEEMEELYEKMKSRVDKKNMVTFSALTGTYEFEDVMRSLFIPMLFLAQGGRVFLLQEEFFGEIIIHLN
jgi:segregation and condensation protein A